MRVIFFVESIKKSPSTRFRIIQLIPFFKRSGIECKIIQGYPGKNSYFSHKNKVLSLILNCLILFLKVITLVFQMPSAIWADVIYIQRTLVSYNLVYLEKLLFMCKKPIVFDFDDAIYLHKAGPNDIFTKSSFLQKLVKKTLRVNKTIMKSDKIFAGNAYLAKYAKKYNKNVIIIPTVINTDDYYPLNQLELSKKKTGLQINIGWMGTSGNLKYLIKLSPIFKKIHTEFPNTRLLICSDKYLYKDDFISNIPTTFIKWEKKRELEILHKFDIGLMPLDEDEWSKGKCGFKLIQYMASGVPAIASKVGVNQRIIDDGINGYLVNDQSDWYKKITNLIKNQEIKTQFRQKAREKILGSYSINTIILKMIQSFKEISG